MKASEINKFILDNLVTYQSVQIVLNNDKVIYGIFEFQENSDLLAKENKWCFIQNHNISKYYSNNDKTLIDLLEGNEIKSIKNFKDQLREYYKQKLHEAMNTIND
jgi:hypothetical protein